MVLFTFSIFHQISSNVSAQATNEEEGNWGVEPIIMNKPNKNNTENSEKTWQGEHDEVIFDHYGSDQSPSFLNREDMNPNESDYGYGSPDGNE